MIKDIGLLSVGQETLLAGFGDNDGVARSGGGKLRFVKTTILDPAYGKSELTVDQSKGKGACYGDSGGPAYVEIEGKLHVAGVTSRGEEECLIATIYTSTAAHVDWISEASQRLTLKHAAPTLAPIALGN
ncbi:MAG: trypsin-like serine protease, partial [Bdellovibrionota bacterium]